MTVTGDGSQHVIRTAVRRPSAIVCLPLLTMSLLAGGCSLVQRPTLISTEERAALSDMRYPRDAEHGQDLDIVVIRDGANLAMVNREPRRREAMFMWLNQQFVGRVETIEVGTGNRLDLARFVNEYGETFPLGGLLTPDKGAPVIQAELFDPATGLRHRVVTRLVDDQVLTGTVDYE